MMTKVRGAKRERWDKMSFPSDWFSYSSNYVAAIWPWLQLWVAFHDMYTWGLEELFWCFLETKLGRRCQKYGRVFFLQYFQKHFVKVFEARVWSQFQRKHIQAFSWDTEKERGKFGVWNQPSFLFTNQLHSFSCFKRFSPAQHKLDVSNAHRLGCIIRYWGGFYHWQSFLQSLFSFWNLLRWKVDVFSFLRRCEHLWYEVVCSSPGCVFADRKHSCSKIKAHKARLHFAHWPTKRAP